MQGMERHREALLALRGGTMSFGALMREMRELLEARAAWFHRRYRQTLLTPADLVQEMSLAVWRAVDAWDPERRDRKGEPISIVRFVDYQVGKAATLELTRAMGWPDKRRKQVAQQVGVEDVTELLGGYEPTVEMEIDRASRVTRIEAQLHPVDRQVLGVVVSRGVGAVDAARVLYADRDVRLQCRWDCARDARRDVVASVQRIEDLATTIND